jgi:phycocyanobilin:ferredoxin oxidoreductase
VTLIRRLEDAADALAASAIALPGATVLPAEDWLARARAEGTLRRPIAWRNTVVATPTLRRLHVEFFAIPGEIAVLHACAFPHLDQGLPIYGFDVIAGQDRATGCFLDLSPTVPEADALIEAWAGDIAPHRDALGTTRILPEWTAIFSPRVVAVRPADAVAFQAGLDLGAAALRRLRAAPRCDAIAMAAAQARYIEGQRRNDRTRRMLASCIGADLADAFIAECLFPPVPAPAEAA